MFATGLASSPRDPKGRWGSCRHRHYGAALGPEYSRFVAAAPDPVRDLRPRDLGRLPATKPIWPDLRRSSLASSEPTSRVSGSEDAAPGNGTSSRGPLAVGREPRRHLTV